MPNPQIVIGGPAVAVPCTSNNPAGFPDTNSPIAGRFGISRVAVAGSFNGTDPLPLSGQTYYDGYAVTNTGATAAGVPVLSVAVPLALTAGTYTLTVNPQGSSVQGYALFDLLPSAPLCGSGVPVYRPGDTFTYHPYRPPSLLTITDANGAYVASSGAYFNTTGGWRENGWTFTNLTPNQVSDLSCQITISLLARGPYRVTDVFFDQTKGLFDFCVTDAVTPTLPTATLTGPATVCAGQSALLSWMTTDATTLDISGVPGPLGPVATGSVSVAPSVTTTYTLTATGPGGTAMSTWTVTILPLPTATLSADPRTILAGGSALLTWTSSGGAAASLNGYAVPLSGTETVSPTVTTDYVFQVSGTCGAVMADQVVTVHVGTPAPAPVPAPCNCDWQEGLACPSTIWAKQQCL